MSLWSSLKQSLARFTKPPKPSKKPRPPWVPRWPSKATQAKLPWVTARDQWAPMRGRIMRFEGNQVNIQTEDGNSEWAPVSTVRPRAALAKSEAILRAKVRPKPAKRAPKRRR